MSELGVGEATVKRAAKRMADRGELLVHERSSSGQGGARRGTEWQLATGARSDHDPGRIKPNTIDPTSETPQESQFLGRITGGNGDDPTSEESDLEELIRRAEGKPDPDWLTW
jgi:hypothetical protein